MNAAFVEGAENRDSAGETAERVPELEFVESCGAVDRNSLVRIVRYFGSVAKRIGSPKSGGTLAPMIAKA